MHLYCLFSTQVNVLLLSLTEAEGWKTDSETVLAPQLPTIIVA